MNDTAIAGNKLDNADPLTFAEKYIERKCTLDGDLTLRYWQGVWFLWDQSKSCYAEIEDEQIVSDLWNFTPQFRIRKKPGSFTNFAPDAGKVHNIKEAVKARCYLRGVTMMPQFIDTYRPAPENIISFRNGLLDLTSPSPENHVLRPPTPLWFSTSCLPYDYLLTATCPQWCEFLSDVFDDDQELIDLLQEWAGYCLTADTSQHKMMVLLGQRRSGKGTILRVFQRMIGQQNVASPSLAELADRFGMASLLNKALAIVGDAHLGRRSDTTRIVENLKMITGEDPVNVDRKNRDVLAAVRLRVRFMIGTNELPNMADASAALVPRLLIVPMRKSYVGKEDRTLDSRLATETPGIMLWALQGLYRLRANGTFTRPQAAEEELAAFEQLSSPLKAFIEERCVCGRRESVDCGELYADYQKWAAARGHKPLAMSSFGVKLNAAAGVRKKRPWNGGERSTEYEGISLRPEPIDPDDLPDWNHSHRQS